MKFSLPPQCEVLQDASLAAWCTLHIGGPAHVIALPDSTAMLVDCIKKCLDHAKPFRVIGRGSNLLCADEGYAGVVLPTQKCRSLRFDGTRVVADCGVPLQVLLREMTKHGLGGIEYLMSVPGNVGGAIVTNAGRGRHHKLNIDEFVREVTVFDGTDTFTLSREQCEFAYRTSIFQKRPNLTLLSAVFDFPTQDSLVGQQRIRARIEEVQPIQDRSHPNAGSVFKRDYQLDLRGYRAGGARFSIITPNWIVNDREATSANVVGLLEFVVEQHEARNLPAPVVEWQTLGFGLSGVPIPRCIAKLP
jgi:UDP-N-acetylmuramate dehydrogenase